MATEDSNMEQTKNENMLKDSKVEMQQILEATFDKMSADMNVKTPTTLTTSLDKTSADLEVKMEKVLDNITVGSSTAGSLSKSISTTEAVNEAASEVDMVQDKDEVDKYKKNEKLGIMYIIKIQRGCKVQRYGMKNTKKLGKLMHKYCTRNRLDLCRVSFRHNGNLVAKTDTCVDIDMADGDTLHVFDKLI